MMVIVASPLDVQAATLAGSMGSDRAAVLSPVDLCVDGWSMHDPCEPGLFDDRIVADGHTLPMSRVSRILTRLPAVSTDQLWPIRETDREYAAQEAHAFLLAWLHRYRGLTVNPPSSMSLCGPGWSPRGWALAASEQGLRVDWEEVVEASVSRVGAPRRHPVSLVGRSVVSPRHTPRDVDQQRLLALAETANVGMMTAWFDENGRFVGAEPWLDLEALGVRSALDDLLESKGDAA